MSKFDNVDLDPQDWEAMRTLGHDLVDLAIEYHQGIRDHKVWQPVPEAIKPYFSSPLPTTGQSQRSIINFFTEHILPYPTGNIHPRFWGWVHGTGTTFGAFAEFLATIMNPNTGGRDHAANYIETQIIEWSKEMMGFNPSSSGIVTSGCTMANLTCLAVARNAKSRVNSRTHGLQGISRPMTIYASSEVHSSIQKSVEVLGIGSQHLRKIAVDNNYSIRIDELRTQIQEDRLAGFDPIAIVGSLGTVNTGAIDDLAALSAVAKEEDLWYHIDGAFGALLSLLPEENHRLIGLKTADSLAFDMHKWLSVPYEIGIALVQDYQQHRDTFYLRPDYLSQTTRGLASPDDWATDFGIELSRGFRSLKAWMIIKEHGINTFQKILRKNLYQAQYLADKITATAQLELLAPVNLNIVCYRYVHPNLDTTQLNQLNEEVLLQIQESGQAVVSQTTLQGRFCLRVAIVNHRSVLADFDHLVDLTIDCGNSIVTEHN